MSIDANELASMKAIAEAVAPLRPWEWRGRGEHGYPQEVIAIGPAMLVAECFEGPDFPSTIAEHIATFDPPTVLALIAEVERLNATIQDHDDLHDIGREAMKTQRDALRAQVSRVEAVLDDSLNGSRWMVDAHSKSHTGANAVTAIRAALTEPTA